MSLNCNWMERWEVQTDVNIVCVCVLVLRQACAERSLVLVKSEGEPEYLQKEREGKQERPLGHCPVGGQTLEWERERKHTHVREKASFIQFCVQHRSTPRNERPADRCTAHSQTHTYSNVTETEIHKNKQLDSRVQTVNSGTDVNRLTHRCRQTQSGTYTSRQARFHTHKCVL